MSAHRPTMEDGRASLVMFARGDRVFPVDDLGGGVWSRRGTVLSVHPASLKEVESSDDGVRVESALSGLPSVARATILWDDGSAEVLAEDKLCLVYDQEAPVGIRVVTMPMTQPCDVVQHGGQVVLVLREGLLRPADVAKLREDMGRVRAALTTSRPDPSSVAELRRRDLDLLNALIAELTGGPADSRRPSGGPHPATQPSVTPPSVTPTAGAQPAGARPAGGQPAPQVPGSRQPEQVRTPPPAPGYVTGPRPRPGQGDRGY